MRSAVSSVNVDMCPTYIDQRIDLGDGKNINDIAYANHAYIAVGLSNKTVKFINADTGSLGRSIDIHGDIIQLAKCNRTDLNILLVCDASGRLTCINC